MKQSKADQLKEARVQKAALKRKRESQLDSIESRLSELSSKLNKTAYEEEKEEEKEEERPLKKKLK